MRSLIEAALTRVRTIISLLVLILVMGINSYITIPRESAPDIKIPIIFVSVFYEGISPEDSQRLLLRPMEQKIRTIEGLKEVKGTAYENGGNLVIEFVAGYDVDKALSDVREQVDLAKSDLPEEAEEPVIRELAFSQFPILVVKLTGAIPERELYRIARDLKEEIESRVSSVLKANVVGDREESVEIVIDPTKLETYNISFESAIAFFQRNNLIVSAGTLETDKGRFSVKVPGLLETVDDIRKLPIAVNKDSVVKLEDFVEIRQTFKDALSYARDGGVPSVAVEISKRAGENIIETTEKVRDVVEESRSLWPEQIQVSYAQDQSDRIQDMLGDLQDNLIFAVILVMVVIIASLGWRSALLVGIAVPGSFLAGVLVINLLGYTFNIVVLFSLILSVGMLVDGAIIVTEYADRRMMEGFTPFESYREAAQRMAWPVITSISTTLVVFAPLLFWPGTVGQFMKFLPITLLATLSASILMALFFIPALGSVFGGLSPDLMARKKHTIQATEDGDLFSVTGGTGAYIRILNKLLDYPKCVVLGTTGLLVAIIIIYSNLGKGIEFFPDIEADQAAITVHARGNLSLREQDEILKQVEARILDMEELSSIYTRVGKPGGKNSSGSGSRGGGGEAEDVIGKITLEFVEWQDRRKVDQIMEDILIRTADVPGIKIEARADKPGPKQGKPIELQVYTPDPAQLKPTVQAIRRFLEDLDGLKDIEDDSPIPGIRWEINIDRAQAAKFGADIALVGAGLRLVTNGFIVGTYRPDDATDEVDIIMRYPKQYRTLDQLDRIRVRSKEGLIPISNFISRSPEPRIGFIHRSDGNQVMTLKADVLPGVLTNDKVNEIRNWLQTAELVQGTRIQFKGEDENQQEAKDFLIKAFFVAVFAIAIILITQFNSFFSAGLVLSSIVMSVIGVLIGLLVRGMPFGIVMGGIGVIALSGIIVSNNIILIDTFDRLRPLATSMRDAVLRTGAQRLRPVVLTQLTTILGLLPILLALNINFLERNITYDSPATQWWIMLATCIVSGLIFASVLTLVVTPCALMWRENWRANRIKSPSQKKTTLSKKERK